MAAALRIVVFDKGAQVYGDEFDGPIELGRQRDPRDVVYSRRREADRWRVAIAGPDEDSVSRRNVLLEPLAGGMVRVSNASALIPLRLVGGGELAPQASREMPLPVFLIVGRKTVRVDGAGHEADAEAGEEGSEVRSLNEATLAPGRTRRPRPRLPGAAPGGVDVESLVEWFQAIIGVLQTAASSSEFFERAARAVVEIVGFDTGQVLVLDRDEWRVRAQHDAAGASPGPGSGPRPGWKVLGRLRREKRTFWHEPEHSAVVGSLAGALSDLTAVAAAPILDRQGEVVGALYGERRPGEGGPAAPRNMKVDAMLVELLSSGVATGLARIEQEKAVMAARVQFEQFFTPALAAELEARPDLLKGRNVEVTLLFCDIRGFSRISERIGPAGTVEWIGDVMGTLSDCVLDHQGVLVDYLGDELIAMWGAPKEEPAHARLACAAALEMLERLPELNRRWSERLGEDFRFGIGINTGLAQVGNTGTHRKFKYGPLGNTVNLASRVQGATRYLRTTLVITGTTRAQLDETFAARRLCQAAVVNISEPVVLFELATSSDPSWPRFRDAYEQALNEFEGRHLGAAIRILGNLIAERPDDGPSLILLSRAVHCMVDDVAGFDPVWTLPGK